MDQKLEQTIETLEALIAEEPHNPDHHKELGNAFHVSGAYDLALEEYRTALHIDPNFYKAQYNMGNTYFAQERFDQSIISWQKALIMHPELEHAIYNIAFTYFRMGTLSDNPEQSRRYFDDAVLEFQKAIALRPENLDSHLHLGLTWYELERYEEAMEEYLFVLERNKKDSYAHYNLGNVYYELGAREASYYEKALKEYKTAIKLNPQDSKSHNNIGDCHLRMGNLSSAKRETRKVLKVFPNYLPAHCTMGEIFAAEGNHGDAIKEFKRILELDPVENHVLHKYASRMLIEEYNRLIEKTPNAGPLHYELALAYKDLGIAYGDRAYLHKAQDEFRTALRLIESKGRKNKKGKEQVLALHIELGETYLLLNNLELALMEVESALVHDPDSIAAHCILGEIYVHAGDKELACSQFSYIKKAAMHARGLS